MAAALAVVGAVCGQNPPTSGSAAPRPSSVPAGKEESAPTIEVAKREFDAVKSLREFGPDARDGVPRLTMPTMPGAGIAPAVAPPGSALKRPEQERQPSKNWLVDAMEKRPNEKGARPGEDRDSDREHDPRDPRDSRSARARGDDEEEKRNRTEPPNPFSRYLGDWMTPQDLALLKPALDAHRADNTGLSGARPAGAGDSAFSWSETGAKALAASPKIGGRLQQANPVRENPYLEALGGGRPPAPPVPLPASPPSGSFGNNASVSPNISPVPPNPLPARPGQVPEFVRPNTDEKHFKQLKRF